MISLDDFEIENKCFYKDECYFVRDNGAVFRYPLEGKRPQPTDNNWTFCKPNSKTGYLEVFAAAGVLRLTENYINEATLGL